MPSSPRLWLEVFDGNTADPATVATQVDTLRRRFALTRVVLVGDRDMLTSARIREDIKPAGLDWISVLRATAIQRHLWPTVPCSPRCSIAAT